jgi:hypothetical protein
VKYNRFFNLHIPKTGGTYFRENILKPIEPYLNENGISTDTAGNGGEGSSSNTQTFHWCWYEPYVQDGSYIFTSFRDPAKRTISHYAWQALRAVSYGISDYTEKDINVNNFYKWLEEYKDVYSDFQSKNLIYYNTDHSIYKEAIHNGWKKDDVPRINSFLFDKDFANYSIDSNQVFSNIKRINLFVKNTTLEKEKYQIQIRDKIVEDLGLAPTLIPITNEVYGNFNPVSNELFKSFTSQQIEKLYDFNPLDSEIFFNNNLFYQE